ncbi:MAG: glycolate oxidase subunit GlcE, partial [Janthinobacterium lividum]
MDPSLQQFRERVIATADGEALRLRDNSSTEWQVLQNFRETVLSASAERRPVRLRGSGSKDWYGQAVHGELIDTADYAGIVEYEPTELVITARCGTPLAEIEAALAEQRQMLAFEPPWFGPNATVGGMVSAGLAGPRRQAVGSVRDFVLGADLMDGRGDVLHFGGRVMKNVAGYDVSRLLAGAMGSLGIVLEVSLKVLPLPLAETTLRFEFRQADAIVKLNEWAGLPLPITASAWHDGVLMLRLSGAAPALAAAQQRIGGETVEQGDRFWIALREQSNEFFRAAQPAPAGPGLSLWRLSLPPLTKPVLPGLPTLIEWGGAQRWVLGEASAAMLSDQHGNPAGQDGAAEAQAVQIRAAAAAAGGHATLFRGGDKRLGVFQPLAPAVA